MITKAIWLVLAVFAVHTAQADAIYAGGGHGTTYGVTITKNGASFMRTGPHDSGATLPDARLVSRKGSISVYAAPIPRKFWSAFPGSRRPVECRMVVTFGNNGKNITGIRSSQPCNFFHGAELGFGLYDGDVLHLRH